MKFFVIKAAITTAVTGKDIGLHHRELELGKTARTLDPYALYKVEIVKTAPLKMLGIELPFFLEKKREVIYHIQN